MFARIGFCLKRSNIRQWRTSPVACGRTMSSVKDQANIKIDGKEKDNCDYEISQDAQTNIKDIDGKNIKPIDINPWNQDSNEIEEKSNEKQQKAETQAATTAAAAAK